MKYKQVCVFISIFVFILLGCNNSQQRVNSFEEITYKRMLNKNIFIAYGGQLIPVKDYLFGIEYSLDTCFYQLGLKNNLFERFGNKGQGPNDFLMPQSIQYISDTVVGVYDMLQRSYVMLDISLPLENRNTKKLKVTSFDHFSFQVLKTCFDQYIGIGPYENGMFELLDSTGNTINYFFEFPFKDNDEKEINNRLRAMAYQGEIVLNPKRNKLVYACGHGNIIQFYEIKNNSIEVIKKIENSYPDYVPDEMGGGVSAVMKKENKVDFVSIYATNEYVYALYSGLSLNDFIVNNKQVSGNLLYIYTWKGEIKRTIKLNMDCRYICATPDNKILYAVSDCPEPDIIYFELP
jgi:hypothetical protein